MLLSELIAMLERDRAQHGDCPVQVCHIAYYERATGYQYKLDFDYLAEREATFWKFVNPVKKSDPLLKRLGE